MNCWHLHRIFWVGRPGATLLPAVRVWWRPLVFLIVLLGLGLSSCGGSARASKPVTITLLDPSWVDSPFSDWRAREIEKFTHDTGIGVKLLPVPETAIDQLTLWRTLFDRGPDVAPDVFAIDVIWPGIMANYALDLRPYLGQESAADFPLLVANDTVNDQLVALPYQANAGLLFYRTDLLSAYGYKSPPATWGDLEKMAARIQAGERAHGKKNFWGFVWEGAAAEGLTCNALEWQASEGGGRIIEPDGTITVNNPRAIYAWERAARWVGTISPPGVVAYREWDALNLWREGNAAFMRNWPTLYAVSRNETSIVRDRFGVSPLPGGRAGSWGTLGGASLSVFRYSRHPKEAVALARYLCSRDAQLQRSRRTSQPPTIPDLYRDPQVLAVNPHFQVLETTFRTGIVQRPSGISGAKYVPVSEAYFNAVHSVLTRQRSGKEAAAKLEGRLAQITGLKVKDQ